MALDVTLARHWRPTRRQWQGWARREPVLRTLTYDQLRTLLDVATATPGLRADGVLAALWRLARHDREAGRLLLVCLAPGLRSVAGRYRDTLGQQEAFTVAVAAVWDRVARHRPFERDVAYRLQWLAGRRVHRAAVRERVHASHREHPCAVWDPVRAHQSSDVEAAATGIPEGLPVRVLLAEAVGAGIVSQRDAWVVWATEVAGLGLGEAAERAGMGYEAAKKARQRATARLRAWLEEAA
jgi:hypothetical protein